MDAEHGVVDLLVPGVHGAENETVGCRRVPGHGLQSGDAHGGETRGEGQSLGGGHADADAGEGAGAVGHGDGPAVLHGESGVFQHILHHGHQGAAVGQAGALEGGGDDLAVLRHGGGAGPGRGLQSQNFHGCAPPSTVMSRQPSCSG